VDASKVLRRAGLRNTPGRRRLLELLGETERPLSQPEMVKELAGAALNKTNIYRALEKFLELELVHKAYEKDGVSYYEASGHCRAHQCHPHFTCMRCGITQCIRDNFVPLIEGLHEGYVIHHQKVLIEGLCPGCSGK